MSSHHEEQDCCQTIKAAEVVNVTNNMNYILNLIFNRQQNCYFYRICRIWHWTNRKYFFSPRRSRYYEEQHRSWRRDQPSTVWNPIWWVDVLKILNTKEAAHTQKYPARKLVEVTASRHLKLSTHAGGIETKLNSTSINTRSKRNKSKR